MQSKIVDLESRINNLQQTAFNLLSVINSVVSTQNASALNSLYAAQQTHLQSGLFNPYNSYYNSLYDLRTQSYCNSYKGHL